MGFLKRGTGEGGQGEKHHGNDGNVGGGEGKGRIGSIDLDGFACRGTLLFRCVKDETRTDENARNGRYGELANTAAVPRLTEDSPSLCV